jgi:trimethylamine---corrinoid protein Co-methyltransferase
VRAILRVLADDERAEVHERTVRILARTGVRVDTSLGRRLLADAGAHVDEASRLVRLPADLIERCVELAPRRFALGGRRTGFAAAMNAGDCTLLADGGATQVCEGPGGVRRQPTRRDWLDSTRLIDVIDEVGVYWQMVEYPRDAAGAAGWVEQWSELFRLFGKHVQDSLPDASVAVWLREVLDVVFGGAEAVRQRRPFSFLITPTSPLVVEGDHTDAWLALRDTGMPVAIMPMPLMGATSPASMLATIVQANCETLAVLCLVQVAAPGTPVIYAPVPAVADPRTGAYAAGAVGASVMAAAGAEMARFYGLPVEASGCATTAHEPGVQAAYEKATTLLTSALSWPDILVGPGLLAGATVFSAEQLIIDVELFGLSRQVMRGVAAASELWLDDVLGSVGPGGSFLGEKSTRRNARSGEWRLSELGFHPAYESWVREGRPDVVAEARERVEALLARHQPVEYSEDQQKALAALAERARRA